MRPLFAALCLSLLLGACEKATAPVAFNNVDITGATYAKDFSLTDHTGAKRTLADYRGKVVTVFFGFTQCPDVCPTTLNDMVEVKKRLGAQGDGADQQGGEVAACWMGHDQTIPWRGPMV